MRCLLKMNLRLLKTIAIGTYLVAGLLAVFFSAQSLSWIIGWRPATDLLAMFILPYGLFMLITWRLNNRFDYAVVSIVVSLLVLAYTLVSYVPTLDIVRCRPLICGLVFAITPFILTVGSPWVFLVGVLGVNIFSRLTGRSV
jgi:hypothetical protein